MTEKNRRNPGPALILLAGCLWGSMGIFVRYLNAYGFTSIQIASVRVTLTALAFWILLPFRDGGGLKVTLREVLLFLALGCGSVLVFTTCYFAAIERMPLSAAAILLYTSPIWIMLMSVLFFREKLTGRKLLALILAFSGCVLVSGISGEGITLPGLILGLCSGIGYGLYSILGTIALRRSSAYKVTAWAFLFAAAVSWLICRPGEMISRFAAAEDLKRLLLLCGLTALVTAVIPYLAYTLGLRTVEPGRAGILATVEPMVAALLGILVFSEPLSFLSALGMALILAAVILLNRKGRGAAKRASPQ